MKYSSFIAKAERIIVKKKSEALALTLTLFVDPPGLEPGLYGTKIRRVANYTMGQYSAK